MWGTRQGRLTIVFAIVAATAWWLMHGLIEEPHTSTRTRTPNYVATDISAVETDRPSPSAGLMHPTQVVKPAVTMEVNAMRVVLSIAAPWLGAYRFCAEDSGPDSG